MEDKKKLITICQVGGVFDTNKDGTLTYNGGEAHAIDIDNETAFEDFKSEVAEILKCSAELVSFKYFLPGNKKTLITISNDRELKRMITFSGDSVMVEVYVTSGEVVVRGHSNVPAIKPSQTTLSEAIVPADVTPLDVTPLDTQVDVTPLDVTPLDTQVDVTPLDSQVDDVVHTQNDNTVDAPTEIPVDNAPPIILPISSDDVKPQNVPSAWKNAITGVRQRFRNAIEFRESLRKYAMAHAFAYICIKNDSRRVTVKCKSEGCPWRIHASKLLRTQFFCIKKINPKHTCEGGVMTRGSYATIWAAEMVKEKLQNSPKYKPKDIANDMKREFGVELNYYQAYRAKEIATEKLRGTNQEAYSQLPILCEKIKETNPGSFATFTTKDDSSFHRLFISFHASLQGFQLGCRPLLFLDSLPLNSKYKQTLLVATAVDGDDAIFPVAFAVVEDETVDNWHWFLMELKSAVSTSRPLTFVADRDKGLRESIAEVFENSYHGYCLRYLTESFRKDLPKHFSNEVKGMLVADFHDAAYALKFDQFQSIAENIKGISPEAFNWVVHSKPEHWANAFFEGSRSNHLTSNFGESFYNWVLEAFELPITQMVHMIGGKMMELVYTRNVASSQWLTKLTPSMEERLQKEITKAQSLQAEVSFSPGTDGIFDVRGDSFEKVDIDQGTCSCKGWQITGLPCCHAVAVFKCINRNPYDYCSKYFTTESYRLTYSNPINPVPDVDKPMLKESSEAIVVVTPPPTRNLPGRPRKRRTVSEGSEKKKLKAVRPMNLTCKEAVLNNNLVCKEAVEGRYTVVCGLQAQRDGKNKPEDTLQICPSSKSPTPTTL